MTRPSARRVALTGTPGTGKSSVAKILSHRWPVEEVAALAPRLGAARSTPTGVEVDLRRLRTRLERDLPSRAVWVGHLAHLLPVRDVVVLRCHPLELLRRLDRAERGSRYDRVENVAAEATDVVLLEALGLRRRVWEVDTTSRGLRSVAAEVARLLARRPPPAYGRVDWLADPRVTDYLLRSDR